MGARVLSPFTAIDRLRGRLVALRSLRVTDASALDTLLRDGRVTRLLPPRVRRETGRQFVTRVLREQRRGEGVSFAVLPLGSDEVIGQIRLINWSRSERTAEVGYWFRRKYWGRGFATDALRLTCRFGFRHLSLHRIEAIVVVGNVGSRRVLEHVGFRLEGRSRRAARLAVRWADEWRFGLLRGELRC
ncbi:MAG: GNAT family N-acetyltransferase [Thermoplasmata archaeon]|nr:GNAT family N-acetyltransferase [Thermoplasmata archaeon]